MNACRDSIVFCSECEGCSISSNEPKEQPTLFDDRRCNILGIFEECEPLCSEMRVSLALLPNKLVIVLRSVVLFGRGDHSHNVPLMCLQRMLDGGAFWLLKRRSVNRLSMTDFSKPWRPMMIDRHMHSKNAQFHNARWQICRLV